MTADSDKISVPRPKPDEVIFAATDADGASAWVVISKSVLGDPDFLASLAQMAFILEDGQRLVHEQRKAATA